MNLKKCETCRFKNDENCYVFEICRVIELTGLEANIKEALANSNSPAVNWALKQA